MTRGQSYLHRFMASLAYPSLLAAAEEDYATLDEQRRYVDSLIQEERQTLQRLEDNFTAIQEQRRYFDTTALEGLLQEAGVAESLRRAAAAAAEGSLRTVEGLQGRLELAAAQDTEGAAVALAHSALRSTPLTEQQRQTARAMLADKIDATTLEQLFAQYPVAAGLTVPAVTGAEAEAARLLGELQAAAPDAIIGGAAGEAEVERRETTPVESEVFTTEDDAYRAALASLDRGGTINRDDFATDEDYQLAKRIYVEAKAKGAYENQERLFFERSVLESRARLAELRGRAEEIARPAGLSRQQEVQRLVLERQGYDMDKPLARYQKSAYYQVLLAAEDMYRAGLSTAVERGLAPKGIVVGATDAIQQKVQAHIDNVISARGLGPLDVPKVEKQLRRGLSLEGDQLQSALAYAIAYNRSRIEGIDSPETAKAAQEAQAQAERDRKAAKRDADAAAAVVGEAEELNLITELEGLATIPHAYVRQRAAGATPEEARRAAGLPSLEPAAPEPAPAPRPSPRQRQVVERELEDDPFLSPLPSPAAPPPAAPPPAAPPPTLKWNPAIEQMEEVSGG